MKRLIFIAVAFLACLGVSASEAVVTDTVTSKRIVKGRVHYPEMDEKVIVGSDTVNLVLQDRNFGRYDRGLFNYLFIPKKQWAFELMASYSQFDADDVEIL